MHDGFRTLMMAVLTVGLAMPASAQIPGATPDEAEIQLKPMPSDAFQPPRDKGYAAKIEQLIARLGAPRYEDRQEAANELLQIGLPALAQLRQAYREAEDLEVRLRIEEVVRQAYFNHHVFDDNGFLGISMYPYETVRARGGRIRGPAGEPPPDIPKDLPPGTVAVVVSNVIPDTGAHRGGVQNGDVILAVDGQPLKGAPADANAAMSKAIRTNPPGTTLTLTVRRGDQELQLEVTLGRAPEANVRGRVSRVFVISDLYRKASEYFPSWWAEHFRSKRHSARPAATDD